MRGVQYIDSDIIFFGQEDLSTKDYNKSHFWEMLDDVEKPEWSQKHHIYLYILYTEMYFYSEKTNTPLEGVIPF